MSGVEIDQKTLADRLAGGLAGAGQLNPQGGDPVRGTLCDCLGITEPEVGMKAQAAPAAEIQPIEPGLQS